MSAKTVADPAEGLRQAYVEAILAVDGTGATAVATRALREGLDLASLYDRVIGAAMVEVGERWADGSIDVADEHAATAITHRVLATTFALTLVANPSHKVRVLLGAPAGQRHSLGVRMAADVLEVAGYSVVNVGSDLPTDSLLSSVWRHQPHLVGLSSPTPIGGRITGVINEIRKLAPAMPVIIGGAGAPDLVEDGLTRRVERLDGLDETLKDLLGEAPPPPRIERPGAARGLRRVRPREPGDATLAETESVAELVRKKAREAVEFRQLALVDPVSGLPNRRAFDDRFEELFAAGRSGVLMMMDLDNFKEINDTFGHERGDQALADVAALLEGVLRADGFAARFGGDEFAILLPDAAAETAQVAAERIRDELEKLPHEPPLTVSIGLAPFTEDPRGSLISADQALYGAKAAGRNTVVVWDGADPVHS